MTKKTDTKAEGSTSVAVVEKRLIGQPGVIAIGGVILEPIAQFNKVNGPIVHNGVLLFDYAFMWVGDRNAKLSLYTYSLKDKVNEGKAVDLFILADELSSLDIHAPQYLDFQDESFSMIVLANSVVQDTYFRGTVALVNVDTSGCAFTNSIIEMRAYYYGEDRSPSNTRRVSVTDVDAVQVTFRGSQLPPGMYYRTDLIENKFVRGVKEDDKRKVNITESIVSHCSFREGQIEIHNSTVTVSDFHFTGDVLLDKVTVENQYFRQIPSIHLASKFDLTSIDVAGERPAVMVRIDMDTVIITLPLVKVDYVAGALEHKLCTMSFRNPRSRRGMRNQVKDVLFGETMPSEMEESVVDYFVDTVMSRCSMMNLVDSARRLLSGNLIGVKEGGLKRLRGGMGSSQLSQLGHVNEVGNSTEGGYNLSEGVRTADFYGTSTKLANEYDKTIYIDSAGKF